jgi:spore coat polysaccharide biosynthesis protein SpsF
MKIAAIVQARMSSVRCPGKVLRDSNGKPLLSFLLERVQRASGINTVIVATSEEESDDAIANYCAYKGVPCFRGPRMDVAERFARLLTDHPFDAFVRLCGDSPFLDPAILSRAISLFRETRPDIVTNVFPRSYPAGQSVEVIDSATFLTVQPHFVEADDREHVTAHFYDHPDRFRIENFSHDPDLSYLSLAVDTEADFVRFASIAAAMDRPQWTYELTEIIALYNPEQRLLVTAGG